MKLEESNIIDVEGDARYTLVDDSRNSPVSGGNKIRKLSLILRGVKPSGLLTFGSKYSSHCLASAYWGAMNNCPVRLLILESEEVDIRLYPHLALSKKLGADLVFINPVDAYEAIEREKELFSHYEWVPGGGHCEKGLDAYRIWFKKLCQDTPAITRRQYVILPFGTGTTAMGIVRAIYELALDIKVIGVSVARDAKKCWASACEMLTDDELSILEIDARFSGKYGEFTEGSELLRMNFLRKTGLLFDPIYNVRVLEFISQESLGDCIIVNTGGYLNNQL